MLCHRWYVTFITVKDLFFSNNRKTEITTHTHFHPYNPKAQNEKDTWKTITNLMMTMKKKKTHKKKYNTKARNEIPQDLLHLHGKNNSKLNYLLTKITNQFVKLNNKYKCGMCACVVYVYCLLYVYCICWEYFKLLR